MYYNSNLGNALLESYNEIITAGTNMIVDDLIKRMNEIAHTLLESTDTVLEIIRETLIKFVEYINEILKEMEDSVAQLCYVNDKATNQSLNLGTTNTLRGPPITFLEKMEVYYLFVITVLQPMIVFFGNLLASDVVMKCFGAILSFLGLQ